MAGVIEIALIVLLITWLVIAFCHMALVLRVAIPRWTQQWKLQRSVKAHQKALDSARQGYLEMLRDFEKGNVTENAVKKAELHLQNVLARWDE
jgi:hypothetical protein